MSARRPKHAQPSILAGLRWSTLAQGIGVALLAVLGLGILATVDAPAHPAAARPPAPPAVVASNGASGQLQSDGPFAEQPPGGVSLAPTSSLTFFNPPTGLLDNTQGSALASDGIPNTALLAYQRAADRERLLDPACGLTWPLLAGIGRAESDHGRFAGATLHSDGISTPRVIGIPLNGNGTARILDTDGGRLDGDTVYDRAVGPMQFIPSTWAGYGVDGNGDGVVDPFNIFDAAAAAAKYLCSTGGDLATLAGQMSAVRVYNDSDAYITEVLQLEAIYASGVPGLTVPVVPTDPRPAPPQVMLPPADPGPPLGIPHKPKPVKLPTPKTSAKTSPTPPKTSPASDTTTPCPTVTATATDPSTSTSTSTTATSSTNTSTSVASSSTPTGTDCATPTSTGSTTGSTPGPTTDTATLTPTDAATSTSGGSTSASASGASSSAT
ncbi:MAG: lytic murein transglycosylase [Actinomycetota bacterium]|nr:lytic murein transglycosylase [Actinomycetota bacterium]